MLRWRVVLYQNDNGRLGRRLSLVATWSRRYRDMHDYCFLVFVVFNVKVTYTKADGSWAFIGVFMS